MGEKRNSKWYDNAFTEIKMYQVDYHSIGYYAMWKEILKRIEKTDRIVELGCGVGQFAHLVIDKGYTYKAGYDFSPVAIKKAKERINGNFVLEDLEKADIADIVSEADVVIMCEFLEHIDRDIRLIQQIDKRMIITLPTFDGSSHVRYFPSMEDVLHRYEPVMEIEECDKLGDHYILIGKCK